MISLDEFVVCYHCNVGLCIVRLVRAILNWFDLFDSGAGAHPIGEFHVRVSDAGGGVSHDQQIQRGVPRCKILRWKRVGVCSISVILFPRKMHVCLSTLDWRLFCFFFLAADTLIWLRGCVKNVLWRLSDWTQRSGEVKYCVHCEFIEKCCTKLL
jgi:hypothetical protein